MPSGTGKTISLISLIVAYQKVIEEFKDLIKYYKEKVDPDFNYYALALSSRKNYCIHPEISKERNGKIVDAKCYSITYPSLTTSIGSNVISSNSNSICPYYANYDKIGRTMPMQSLIYNIEDFKVACSEQGICPYFMARQHIFEADAIIFSYNYMLDPKIADVISKGITSPKAVIVFDEAHNIDNVCIQSLSLKLTRKMLDKCDKGLELLDHKLESIKAKNAEKLNEEYRILVEGLKKNLQKESKNNETDLQLWQNPQASDELIRDALPGCVRKADHFVHFLKRWLEYIKYRLRSQHVVQESPALFLKDCFSRVFIDRKPLKICSERLRNLIHTLEIYEIPEIRPLITLANFATLVSTYTKGFSTIIEPYQDNMPTVLNPILYFTCLDASIAIKAIFERFTHVIITSGTLSPIEMYPKILNFHPITMASFSMTLARISVCPLIVTKGNDQTELTTKFEARSDMAVIQNYGNLLVQLSAIVPDGIVCFFTSYLYMEKVVGAWLQMGYITKLQKNKLIFLETPDAAETSLALYNYQKACENGRGAILLSVARGKISEGIDFDHHFGRAVVVFGVPYVYTQSKILKARLDYLRTTYNIRESDFLSFDAMRQAAQCLGRALRGKNDYGIMILADKRFSRNDKRLKLPVWIQEYISESVTDLTIDEAIAICRKFLKSMAIPFLQKDQLGISLLSSDHLQKMIDAQKQD